MNDRTPMGSPSLSMPVETSVGNDPGSTVEVGNPGARAKPETDSGGLEVDIGERSATLREEDKSATSEVDREGGGDGGDGQQQEQQGGEHLPDFDASKPEVVETYEMTYTNEDGSYSMESLSADFYRNASIGDDGTIQGGLSEGTYKYLETKGVSRETAKAIEAGQIAIITQQREAVFSRAGGQANYSSAIAWATGGDSPGYTPQQRQAFNAALDKGGPERDDAIDALMVRFKRANPNGFRQTRPSQRPQRSVTNAGGGNAKAETVKPYGSYAEYQDDLRKARREGDQSLFDLTRRRFKVSKFS